MKHHSLQTQAELVDRILAEFNTAKHEDDDVIKARISALISEYLALDGATENREITILLSDIRGFTALSERYKAADIVRILNLYFTEMNEVILRYGGQIDKYMGDAIMVLFGIQDNNIDPVHRAVACAVEMQIAMDKVNQNKSLGLPELFMGIGINTGMVSTGLVGSELHNEYTVIGDGVNLTSRIEAHSLRGQILVSEHSYKKVKNEVGVGTVNKVRVKGKSKPVTLYELTSVHWDKYLEVPKREIRNSIRIQIEEKFPFQIIKNKTVLPEVKTARLQDLSYHGLFAVSQEQLEPYTDIKLSLSLSILGGETRDIYGKIMSVRKIDNQYGYGIEFTSLDQDSQQSIKSFIDRIIAGL